MVDPETGERYSPDANMLAVAPRDYPQLAGGLEIGALYREVPGPGGYGGILHGVDSLEGYYEWCEKLVSLVTNGKRLPERPNGEVEWSKKLSELVEDKEKYAETEGRGPFWEMLRYALRGMPFGPVVCQKLTADFEKWETTAYAFGDADFTSMYRFMRSTFSLAGETGMVTYSCQWTEDTEPILGIETLALLNAPPVPRHDDDEVDKIEREYDDI